MLHSRKAKAVVAGLSLALLVGAAVPSMSFARDRGGDRYDRRDDRYDDRRNDRYDDRYDDRRADYCSDRNQKNGAVVGAHRGVEQARHPVETDGGTEEGRKIEAGPHGSISPRVEQHGAAMCRG